VPQPAGSGDVSIVLVTYNRERFVGRTIECILAQTYGNFELLICDDCSTDDTQSVCEGYARRDARIRYVRNPSNLGMPGNLNNGIRLARHELLANLHDGDIYDATLIEKWRSALLRFPTAGFVFNQYAFLSADETSGAVGPAFPEFVRGHDFLEGIVFQLRDVEVPVWGTVMGRRSVYLKMGLFDPVYSFWSDIDMWMKIAESHDVAHVPEPLISLPSRAVMPHLFSEKMLAAHRVTFSIHWGARVRHYRGRTVARTKSLAYMSFWFVYIRGARLGKRIWTRVF
jgi:glycosyltransferase involved in cell wall biosynthesis